KPSALVPAFTMILRLGIGSKSTPRNCTGKPTRDESGRVNFFLDTQITRRSIDLRRGLTRRAGSALRGAPLAAPVSQPYLGTTRPRLGFPRSRCLDPLVRSNSRSHPCGSVLRQDGRLSCFRSIPFHC